MEQKHQNYLKEIQVIQTRLENAEKECDKKVEFYLSQKESETYLRQQTQGEHEKDLQLWTKKLEHQEEQLKRQQEEISQQKQRTEVLLEKLKLNQKTETTDQATSNSIKLELTKKQHNQEMMLIRERYERDIEELKGQIASLEKEYRKQ